MAYFINGILATDDVHQNNLKLDPFPTTLKVLNQFMGPK